MSTETPERPDDEPLGTDPVQDGEEFADDEPETPDEEDDVAVEDEEPDEEDGSDDKTDRPHSDKEQREGRD
jgi:hypothetical protein